MSRQHHYLKTRPEYFRAIEKGIKNFEVRFNDRGFKVYDILHLQEWCGGEYTGRLIEAEVTYVLDNPEFCKEGFVVMAIRIICINN